MRCRLKLRVLVILVVGTSISWGLCETHRMLMDQAIILLESALDERNPLLPTEAEWKTMSWEEKRASRAKFAHDIERRRLCSNELAMLSRIALYGIAGTVILQMLIIGDYCIITKSHANQP